MKYSTCPACGDEVASSALHAHQGAGPCRVTAARKWAEETGRVLVLAQFDKFVREAKIDYSYAAANYYPGGPGRRSKVTSGLYVPAWAKPLLQLLGGTTKKQRALLVWAAARLPRDPAFRDALELASKAGAAFAFLTAQKQADVTTTTTEEPVHAQADG